MQQESENKPIYKRWWFWIIILFITISVRNYIVSDGKGIDNIPAREENKSTNISNSDNLSNPTISAKLEVIKITSETLYNEYEQNEVAADEKYKDKVLEVSGVVDFIKKDILDTPYVGIKTSNRFDSTQCYFEDSDINILTSLSKDTNITIQGRCDGQSMGSVLIKECKIISNN